MSQNTQWDWAISAGGLQTDKITDMVIDESDNSIFVCGYVNTAVQFSSVVIIPTLGNHDKQSFIGKIDSIGNWIWVKYSITNFDDRALGMCIDTINHFIYATGTFWGGQVGYSTFKFANTVVIDTSGQFDEIFIVKLDYNGNCIWAKTAGNFNGDDHGFDLVCDKVGNIYLTGFTSNMYSNMASPTEFGNIVTTPIPVGDSLCFVSKIDMNGNFLWVTNFRGLDNERDNRIAIDNLNNIFIAGSFRDTVNYGTTTLISNGDKDIFVVKLDSNGTIQSAISAGSALGDRANSIIVNENNSIFITGEFRDVAHFGAISVNNYGSSNGRDIFVAKLSNSLDWKWVKKAGSKSGNERGNRITINNKGNLFVTGEVRDSSKFGNIALTPNGAIGSSLFIAAIDTSGHWLWANKSFGFYNETGTSIVADKNCNVYLAGHYMEFLSITPQLLLNTNGERDMYVAKLNNTCATFFEPENNFGCQELILPNIFTPNDDKLNDIFNVTNECVENLNLDFYNRWGKHIISIDSVNGNWDGKVNNIKVEQGTYYYVGNAVLKGREISLRGFVQIIY